MKGVHYLILVAGCLGGGLAQKEGEELVPENGTRKTRDIGMETTGQTVIETRVEDRAFNDMHDFVVTKTLEYYLRFDVPAPLVKQFEEEGGTRIFQVNTQSDDATELHPVQMTIRQFRQMKTFQIPHVKRKDDRIVYQSQKKSIDFCPTQHIDNNSTLFISLSTTSVTPVKVTVRVLVKGKNADWIEVNNPKGELEYHSKTTIRPVTSRIRFFNTSLLNTDSIIVKVTTRNDSDCLCSIISIQEPICPFYDEVGTTKRHGLYSTMMDKGTVIVHPKDFPDGFILVLVAASPHEDVCNTDRCVSLNTNVTDPGKRVKIVIASNGSDSDYLKATLAIIFLYLGIFALTITLSILEFRYDFSDFEVTVNIGEKFQNVKDKMADVMEGFNMSVKGKPPSPSTGFSVMDGLKACDSPSLSVAVGDVDDIRKNSLDMNGHDNDLVKYDVDSATTALNENAVKSLPGPAYTNFETPNESFEYIDKSDEDETTYKTVPEKAKSENSYIASMEDIKEACDIETEDSKMRRRMKKDLFVSDLSTKITDPRKTKSVYQKSQLYLGVLFIASIYYALPVLQMVFRFSHEQTLTGNQDICFYNDLCRKPLGHIRDFNHVFSNLGYCVFGVLFMCIVLFKKIKYETFLANNSEIHQEEYGVPCQYGLYFAMGFSLSMEGVMSSSYHICPTTVTFQFDTTFMYLIAVLMFMKLYQVRHSDVSANAIGVFFGLGVALFMETISIYYNGPWFWVFFCSVYIIVIVVVAVHAYNIGAVKYDWKILWVVIRILAVEFRNMFITKTEEDKTQRSQARPRLVCLIIIGLINVALCLYFGISATPGTSNYLLAIFFLNLTLYGCYYCAMKIINGEKIKAIPLVYANLGLICFLPSLYFFTKKEKNTEISPSESRDMNVECQFLDFYDGHDIWHFLGGAGVFFAFLCIFNLDEDVKFKKRNTIRVF